MKTTTFSTAITNFIAMAKEEYENYEKTFNISSLISYEKYRDRIAHLLNINISEADMIITG